MLSTPRFRTSASLELVAGLAIAIGSILPWFAFHTPDGTHDQTGTSLLWGTLTLLGGGYLALAGRQHRHAGEPADRRLIARVALLAVIALAGAVFIAVPMNVERGMTFGSIHVGLIVVAAGVAIGAACFWITRRQ